MFFKASPHIFPIPLPNWKMIGVFQHWNWEQRCWCQQHTWNFWNRKAHQVPVMKFSLRRERVRERERWGRGGGPKSHQPIPGGKWVARASRHGSWSHKFQMYLSCAKAILRSWKFLLGAHQVFEGALYPLMNHQNQSPYSRNNPTLGPSLPYT